MPLDAAAARWQIDILAADKTAAAFDSATKRMKAFGDTTGDATKKNADALGALAPVYDALVGKLSVYAKLAAGAFTVGAIIQRGKEIEDYALKIDKMAKAFKSSTVEAQALDAAAERTGKTAEELNSQLSTAQRKMLGDIYKAAFGDTTRVLSDVEKASARLSDTYNDLTQASRQAMIAMFGDLTVGVLNALSSAIIGWSAAMRYASDTLARIGNTPQTPSVQGFSQNRDAALIQGIGGEFSVLSESPSSVASDMDVMQSNLLALGKTLKGLEEQKRETQSILNKGFDPDGALADSLKNINAQIEITISQVERLKVGVRGGLLGADLANFIPTTDPSAEGRGGISPFIPRATQTQRWITDLARAMPTGGGSGGGKSDNDSIDAQIKRYEALADVAKRAGDTISANHAKNIDDLQREVRVQQQVEEVAAKLGAKYSDADAARKEQLHTEIDLYEKRKAANQLALESAQKAEEIEVKLGDGTRARSALERDLARAKDTGRVSTEALMRVEKQRSEELEQQTLQARRFDDNLGSLGAGFQSAAAQYARANDMFSQGGQIFEGVTATMSDGLDVLLGRSTKTFGQIANDFGMMLLKMSLQAAVSPVWKILSNGIGSLVGGWLGGGSSGGEAFGPPSPFYGPGFAGGGATPAGVPFMVGENGPEVMISGSRGHVYNRQQWGGGAANVNVQIINASAPVKETGRQQRQTSNGTEIKILVAAVEAEIAGNVQRDQGPLNAAMQGKYGLQRAPR